eukprot:56098_1
MGNQPATATIKWSELCSKAKQCEVSSAKDILIRLNIDFPESDNKENKDNNDEKQDNKYNNDFEKYLDDYLDTLSDEGLTKLFVRFGVEPDFAETTNKSDKIQALMLISSATYWQNNWTLHPLQKRIKNWLFVHEKYRGYITEIVNTSSTDLDNAKNLLVKFEKKLAGHSDFEENMLFKFMKENLNKSMVSMNLLDELGSEHGEMEKIEKKAMECGDLVEFQKLIKEYETTLLAHLQKEEENLIHVWLNLDEEQYKKYREYLSWKYAAVY